MRESFPDSLPIVNTPTELFFSGDNSAVSFEEEVSRRIDRRLKALGLKDAEVVRRTGISSAAISRYRSGQRLPSTKHIPALCRVLEWSADELLGIKPVDRAYDPLDRQAHQLIEEIREAVYDVISRKPNP